MTGCVQRGRSHGAIPSQSGIFDDRHALDLRPAGRLAASCEASPVKVTFYGVRGSIATPGPSTVRYGGNTVCVGLPTPAGTPPGLHPRTPLPRRGDELPARALSPPLPPS